jgi:hypothetical protein
VRAFLVQAPRQGCKALFLEDLAHGGGAESDLVLLEGFADLVDGVILLAQSHDDVASGGFLGLRAWAWEALDEEERVGVSAEVVA